jgi:hypothetical protein
MASWEMAVWETASPSIVSFDVRNCCISVVANLPAKS